MTGLFRSRVTWNHKPDRAVV